MLRRLGLGSVAPVSFIFGCRAGRTSVCASLAAGSFLTSSSIFCFLRRCVVVARGFLGFFSASSALGSRFLRGRLVLVSAAAAWGSEVEVWRGVSRPVAARLWEVAEVETG